MTWLSRLYKPTVLSLSQADAAANRAAINAALLAAKGSDRAVYVPPGRWPYNGTLTVDSATLAGEADSVLAGSDGTATPLCAVILAGYRPQLLGLSVEINATTRGSSNNHNAVTLNQARGAAVRGVSIRGSAATGVTNFGGINCSVRGTSVRNNFADGFHHTNGCTDSECIGNTVSGSGDDYFSVVSYQSQAAPVRNVLIADGTGQAQRDSGRGLAVDGGEDVVFRRMTVKDTQTRGVLVYSGGFYATRNAANVLLEDILIDGTGRQAGFNADPGAAAVFTGHNSGSTNGVVTRRVRVRRSTGPLTKNLSGSATSVDFSGVSAG